MSRLPTDAASRNMSACSAQAMSQVGCRLMVASSANTRRPRPPAACGDIARAFATKAAMSSELDARPSGSEPSLREVMSPEDFGLLGSPAMRARLFSCTLYVGRNRRRSMRPPLARHGSVGRLRGLVLRRGVKRHRSRLGQDLRQLLRIDRRDRAVGGVQELV